MYGYGFLIHITKKRDLPNGLLRTGAYVFIDIGIILNGSCFYIFSAIRKAQFLHLTAEANTADKG